MSKASDIVAGLGGADNIVEVEGCIRSTRRPSSGSAPTA